MIEFERPGSRGSTSDAARLPRCGGRFKNGSSLFQRLCTINLPPPTSAGSSQSPRPGRHWPGFGSPSSANRSLRKRRHGRRVCFGLPDPSCFLMDDLLSCLKEFSSSASPSPHQDGWPYRGVPRGSVAASAERHKAVG